MKRPCLLLPALVIAALTILSPVQAQFSNPLKKANKTKTSDDGAGSKLPEYKGVKHAIGITDFTNEAGYRSQWTLGDNLRFMLESALFESGRFVIVERGDLGSVMAEQDLQFSGRAVQASTVAETGKLRSARYIATGAITEVSDETSGEGGGIGIRGIRIGASSAKSAIVLLVKLVDTTTGEVTASKRVRGEAGKSGIKIGVNRGGGSGDFGAFAKTPIGEAAQDCINQAVKFIAESMEKNDVEGSVVALAGEQVVISLGENYGVAVGQKFIVRTDGEILTDPDTGAILDRLEGETTATIEVTRVREKTAYCKVIDGEMPSRGERVVAR